MKKVIFLIFIIWGCSQNILAPKYTFTATFLDAFTNEPIKGIEIGSIDAVYPAGIGVLGGGRTTLKDGVSYSNNKGIVVIPFHRYRKAERYDILIAYSQDKYFTTGNESIKATVFDSKKDIKMVYKLDSKAKVRWKVSFVNKLDDGDSFDLRIGGGGYLVSYTQTKLLIPKRLSR